MARGAAGMTWPTELRRERKNPKKSFGNTEIAGLTIEEEREGGRAAAASAIAPVDGRTESVLRVRVCHISTKNRRRRRPAAAAAHYQRRAVSTPVRAR